MKWAQSGLRSRHSLGVKWPRKRICVRFAQSIPRSSGLIRPRLQWKIQSCVSDHLKKKSAKVAIPFNFLKHFLGSMDQSFALLHKCFFLLFKILWTDAFLPLYCLLLAGCISYKTAIQDLFFHTFLYSNCFDPEWYLYPSSKCNFST